MWKNGRDCVAGPMQSSGKQGLGFMQYRPDIDGLRALAVTSVLLYHLDSRLMPGGFVGVDIFFVISGYLITGIINAKLSARRFRFADFYARRIRRIFPALFAMLAATSLLAMLSLEPALYEKFFHDLRYAALQVSNFSFVRDTGYFDVDSRFSPLLHTWSLGVEEQFYLAWPFLIWMLHRFRTGRRRSVLLVLYVLSFCYSAWLVRVDPLEAFYMLPARAWELGMGGFLALSPGMSSRSKWTEPLAVSGLALILFSLFFLNDRVAFPGPWALPAVAGTLFILSTGASRASLVHYLLSRRAVVFVGKISYSLYLWHWPVIIFYREAIGPDISPGTGALLGLISFVLASGSWLYIEQPFRTGRVQQYARQAVQAARGAVRVKLSRTLLPVCLVLLPSLLGTYVCVSAIRAGIISPVTLVDIDLQPLDMVVENEQFSVYWAPSGADFSEENSQTVSYASSETDTGVYRFRFALPDLLATDKIRLDPARSTGRVLVEHIAFSGGLFSLRESMDPGGIALTVKDLFNLRAEPGYGGLLLRLDGTDPHLTLPRPQSMPRREILLLLAMWALSSFLFLSGFYALDANRSGVATILSAAAVMVGMILYATCFQNASRSGWRFMHDTRIQELLADSDMTDISTYPEPDNQEAVLLGDSHVGYYAWPVRQWCRERNISFGMAGLPACPPLFYEFYGDEQNALSKQYRSCAKRHNEALEKIINNTATRYVFLTWRHGFYAVRPGLFFSKQTLLRYNTLEKQQKLLDRTIRHTINSLVMAGKEVVLLGQVPVLEEAPQKCLSRQVTPAAFLLAAVDRPDCDIVEEKSRKRLMAGKQLFSEIALGSGKVTFFDPENYVTSIFGDKGELLYHDDNHLSHRGSVFLFPFLGRELSMNLRQAQENW